MKKFTLIATGTTLSVLFCSNTFAAQTYEMNCTDGQSLKIAYPYDATYVIMDYEGELRLLRTAVSASGARYVGEGWQWWNKGSGGLLAPLAENETYASRKGVSCSVANLSLERPEHDNEPILTDNDEQEQKPKPFKYE